jgi:hypothetical protein
MRPGVHIGAGVGVRHPECILSIAALSPCPCPCPCPVARFLVPVQCIDTVHTPPVRPPLVE